MADVPRRVPGAPRALVGASPPMTDLRRLLDRIRATNVTVLITGENGTGKEVVARQIHTESSRAEGPFVAVNCSAFNDSLLESELFGHRKGAFTDAAYDKPGLFQVADGGTFFMDEVGDMSPALQVKLLRVLQEGTFLPVGGTIPSKVDVRLIAATNRDLSGLVREGKFREDLYYRINVVHVHMPPLRERRADIPLLVAHFLGRLAEREHREKHMAPEALELLMAHTWPGNVRELENEVERLWVLSGDTPTIGPDLVGTVGRRRVVPSGPPPGHGEFEVLGTLPQAVEALERRMIASALTRARGNKTQAAEALGISRRNLIRKIQGYGLGNPADRDAEGGD